MLARLSNALATHPVSLHLPPEPPLVQGDEVMLEQVLSNLLENVARHTPPGTPVDVSANVADGMLEVAVRDRGPGFPAGEEKRVFEKFHQARPESAQSGFGLGLAICKVIVEAHGGTIEARNAPGGGAEFRFTLPLPERRARDAVTNARTHLLADRGRSADPAVPDDRARRARLRADGGVDRPRRRAGGGDAPAGHRDRRSWPARTFPGST